MLLQECFQRVPDHLYQQERGWLSSHSLLIKRISLYIYILFKSNFSVATIFWLPPIQREGGLPGLLLCRAKSSKHSRWFVALQPPLVASVTLFLDCGGVCHNRSALAALKSTSKHNETKTTIPHKTKLPSFVTWAETKFLNSRFLFVLVHLFPWTQCLRSFARSVFGVTLHVQEVTPQNKLHNNLAEQTSPRPQPPGLSPTSHSKRACKKLCFQ